MADEKDPLKELQKASPAPALPLEIVEALRNEGVAQININILLQQVTQNAANPETALQHAEAVMELSRKYEEHRISAFRERTQAVIDVKKRDPDEVEKRLNNRIRRVLKWAIAACAITGIGGAVLSAAAGGGIVLTGLLALVGVVSIVMSGPLASGESISSSDAIRMVRAVGDTIRKPSPP